MANGSKRVLPTYPKRGEKKFVKEGTLPAEGFLSFNFKYLEEKEGKFSYTQKEKKYFTKVIGRLRDICGMTRKEFVNHHSGTLRIHPIDWNQSSVSESSFGTNNIDHDADAWQFSISSNEHGRIHGFFIEDTFYIRWLDPEHKLDPGLKGR